MPVDYRFRKGLDLPSWHWLNQYPPGASQPGTAIEYDGVRYIYFYVQTGSASSASTTGLYRYDTWTNGWQFLLTPTSGFTGIDIEYDPIRNCLYYLEGNNTTVWRFFNLGLANLTHMGQAGILPTVASAAIGTALPAGASTGASLCMVRDTDALLWSGVDGGTTGAGSTVNALVANTAMFQGGVVGSQIRFTSGALVGVTRIINSVTNSTTVAFTTALGSAPVAGDTFVIELPLNQAATGGTVSTIVRTGAGYPTNWYANSDVEILSGTGAGQRRRIASNDATTLTLAGAVTGNARTGNWGVTPDATSVFRILPSTDFVYYARATASTAVDKMDVVATALAWVSLTAAPGALNGGANLMSGRSCGFFSIFMLRGGGANSVHRYDIGPGTWSANLMVAWGAETISTGAHSSLIVPRRRIFITKESQNRCYTFNLITGELETAPFAPYAAPVGNDGKRAKFLRTADGIDWMYLLRAGGQEFWRLPLEWF